MQTGKLSEPVLKRSVLRRLHKGISVQCREYYGADCAAFFPDGRDDGSFCSHSGGEKPESHHDAVGMACTSVGVPPGFERNPGSLAVAAANNLLAGGAVPMSLMLHALIPVSCEETELQRDMEDIAAAADSQGMEILGGHSQVTAAVNETVYTAVGIGKVCREAGRRLLQPGDELILTKWIALGGTAALAMNYEEELKHRYPFALIDQAMKFAGWMSVAEEARAVDDFGTVAVHDLSQGGIFGALWEMAERAGTGLEVDLKKIPVRQETIEICEYFDVNPYELYSAGSLLIGTEHGETLVRELNRRSIPAVIIGRAVKEGGRVIRNGEDVRYLDRPKQDGWYHLQDRRILRRQP